MKNSVYFLSVLLASTLAFSCGQSTKQDESKSEAVTDISQLTFRDVIAMVFDDEGEGLEWHGEEMPNELKDYLTITEGESCGEGDCGNRLFLISSADKEMHVIIRGDYDLEGDQGYIPRKYRIAPGDTVQIGCSKLCFGDKAYTLPRTIVASSYETEADEE